MTIVAVAVTGTYGELRHLKTACEVKVMGFQDVAPTCSFANTVCLVGVAECALYR